MAKTEVNQNITLKVVMYDRVKKDGTSPLYLRVTIDRKKRDIALKEAWPKKFFDEVRQVVLPRHAKDQDARSVNMVIEDIKGRANRIKIQYYTANKKLTPDLFASEIETYESRDNFLVFWETKIDELYENGLVSATTRTQYRTNLKRYKDFLNGETYVSISDIDQEYVLKYQNWLLRKKKLKYNSSVKAIKVMQTFFNLLPEVLKTNKKAFEKAKTRYVAGERDALDQIELAALKKLFASNTLTDIEQEILRKFLFSCYTGLRISDTSHITRQMISQNKLTVRMKKGERFGKEVTVKLPKFALELIEGRKGLLFEALTDQVCNRWLKHIARAASIEKRLTFHVSRDTFATMFIELGGDVGTLKELMGHSSIATTQIYMKMSEKRAEKLMDNFDNL